MNQNNANKVLKLYSNIIDWNPKKLSKPQVDSDFDSLPAAPRVAECVRYSFFLVEYWLSPNGGIRECTKMSLSFCVLFFLIWLPLIAATTLIASVILQIENITLSVYHILLNTLFAVLISIVIYTIIRHLPRIKSKIDGLGNGNQK
jgi:hypothetical protein